MSEGTSAPLIVAALNGGIGNQYFQYAVARALALRMGVPVGLHKRRYGDRRGRQYALGWIAARGAV